MTDTEREKIRSALITHITTILRQYPDVMPDELNDIYNDVCPFLIQNRRLKSQRQK